MGVDMPFELGIPISKNCKICQVFLLQRADPDVFPTGVMLSTGVDSRSDHGMDPL